MIERDTHLTPHQRRLVARAEAHHRAELPLPTDLAASLLAEGISPDPFQQLDIEDYIDHG